MVSDIEREFDLWFTDDERPNISIIELIDHVQTAAAGSGLRPADLPVEAARYIEVFTAERARNSRLTAEITGS